LPPLPAFKITSRNKHTYLGASVFLVKEYEQEAEVRKRKLGELQGADEPVTDSKQPGRNFKQRVILRREDEISRLTPYPNKSVLYMCMSGIHFGNPVENPFLQNQRAFEKDLQHRSEEFWSHVYDDLTLVGSSQGGVSTGPEKPIDGLQ